MAESARCYVQRYDNLSDVSTAEAHWNSQGRASGKYYGCDDPRKVKFLADGGCQDEPPTQQCIDDPECHGVGQKSGGCWHLTRFSTNDTGHHVPGDKYRRWLTVRDPGSVQLEVTFTTPSFLGTGQDAVKQWLYKIQEAATGAISTTQNIDKPSTLTSFGVKSIPLVPRNYTLSLGYETVGNIVTYPSAWQKPFTVEGGSVMSPEIIKLNFLGTGSPVPTGTMNGYMKTYYMINSLLDDETVKMRGDAATCKALAKTQAAKDRNVYAWGHRNSTLSESIANTCFFYSPHPDHAGSIEQPAGIAGPTITTSQCVDPAKNIFLGCRETYLGAFYEVPVGTQFALGGYIYNQPKTWALQFIQDRGRFMLVSINMSNGTSKVILDYVSQGNVGAAAAVILRQGVELLQGANQAIIQRDPADATIAPSMFTRYEFKYGNDGSFYVYQKTTGLLNRTTLLASYT